MEIKRSQRKPGVYAQWFEITCQCGTRYLIYKHQADTYEKAIEYFHEMNRIMNRNLIGLYIQNAEPYPDSLCLAC